MLYNINEIMKFKLSFITVIRTRLSFIYQSVNVDNHREFRL